MDTKDGITVARCKFGSSSNGQAIIKVEGVLPADPNTVYQFLKISTKDGGKVAYELLVLWCLRVRVWEEGNHAYFKLWSP